MTSGDNKIESLSGTLSKIMSKPNLKLSRMNHSDLSERIQIKDSTLDDLKSHTVFQPTKINNTISTSATSRWSKVRTIYQCVRRLKNPSYKQLNGLDSFHEDLENFIKSKEKHQKMFGSTMARHKFHGDSIEPQSDLSRSKENYSDNNEVYHAARQLEHLMQISRQHEKTRLLFELAADGSETAIEKLVDLIKQDIS